MITDWIAAHPYLAILGFYATSNLVSTMPTPTDNGGVRGTWYYKWAFNFLHATVGASVGRILATSLPPQYKDLVGMSNPTKEGEK